MELSIQKSTSISIHEQLVTQISIQIASGILKPGSKLPSIRALSKKLGIHHNTCLSAYKELEKNGLIYIRHGSGTCVAITDQDSNKASLLKQTEPINLEQLSEFFVQQIQRQGIPWEEALEALNRTYRHSNQQVGQPLIFVDIHADILPIFQTELQDQLKRPVKKILLSQLTSSIEHNSHFIVSRYHYHALKEKLTAILGTDYSDNQITQKITMIDVGAVRQELDLIKQLPQDALVTIISKSTIILQQAEAVIKALRGEEIYIRPIQARHESLAEIQRVLKRSSAIFADWLCVPELEFMTRKPIHTIRTIPTHELDKLKPFHG
jgi:DNA-binding transcriptional regulator YhcF (GntR family)